MSRGEGDRGRIGILGRVVAFSKTKYPAALANKRWQLLILMPQSPPSPELPSPPSLLSLVSAALPGGSAPQNPETSAMVAGGKIGAKVQHPEGEAARQGTIAAVSGA